MSSRPRSLNCDVDVNVIFENVTKQMIDLYWIGYDGQYVRYARNLVPGGVYNIQTFQTHPWVARDTKTGAVICFNNKHNIFFPVANEDGRAVNVTLNIPVYSLREICVQALHSVCAPDVNKLELPEELKDNLREKRTLNCDKEYAPP